MYMSCESVAFLRVQPMLADLIRHTERKSPVNAVSTNCSRLDSSYGSLATQAKPCSKHGYRNQRFCDVLVLRLQKQVSEKLLGPHLSRY